MRRYLLAQAAIALALASAPMALAQERTEDAAVAAFAGRAAADVTLDGVALAGPVTVTPKPPVDVPPSLHEQIRRLMARLDNAYPDVGDARKLHFIADYLDIDFRRLWNAYHPDPPTRPVADARPVDSRPVDARPVDTRPTERVKPAERPAAAKPVRVRPAQVTRVGPVVRAPTPRPTVTRPTRPRG